MASRDDSGVQIIDITDPTDPIAVSAATDNQNNFTRLAGAYSITPYTPPSASGLLVITLIDAKSVTTTTLSQTHLAYD